MEINFDATKQLSTSDVYSLVSQENIYNYYLGETIRDNTLYKCCFHKDGTPSLGFYKTKYGNIRYNCFGCKAEGGAIEFVMNKLQLNFPQALNRIKEDFNLNRLKPITTETKISIKDPTTKKTILIPTERPFELRDKKYWNRFGIELQDLIKANIFPCSKVYYERNGEVKTLCFETNDNPIYCFKIAEGIYKLYRPLNPSKKGKWFSNTGAEDLQGMCLLTEKRDLLFITSSFKDVLVLYKLGYQAVAPCGEGVRIPEKVLDYLAATTEDENIIYFNDSDEAGKKYTEILSKETGYKSIFIPDNYVQKDISDFVEAYNLNEAKRLITTLLERIDGDGK